VVDSMVDFMAVVDSMAEEEGKALFNRLQLIKPCRYMEGFFLQITLRKSFTTKKFIFYHERNTVACTE
jgi:hypothetical protein